VVNISATDGIIFKDRTDCCTRRSNIHAEFCYTALLLGIRRPPNGTRADNYARSGLEVEDGERATRALNGVEGAFLSKTLSEMAQTLLWITGVVVSRETPGYCLGIFLHLASANHPRTARPLDWTP
jgi:hypothetical protein